MNLIEKLGLEKCKQIVDGAPSKECFFDSYESVYYAKDHDHYWEWWDKDCGEWFECEFAVNRNEDGFLELADIRTEIANHERTDTCSDIKNHISPNTKVIEHEQKPKQEVKHGFYDSNCW